MRTPDPNTTDPATAHALAPYQPPTPTSLDPYPERPGAAAGVSETADPHHRNMVYPAPDVWTVEPSSFTASIEHGQHSARSSRVPLASMLIACLAQVLLGLLMAVNYVPTLLGVVIALSILVCSLLLIAAQCVTQATIQ